MYSQLLGQLAGTCAIMNLGKVQKIDFAARQKSRDWRSYGFSEGFAGGAGGGGQVGGSHPKPQTMPPPHFLHFSHSSHFWASEKEMAPTPSPTIQSILSKHSPNAIKPILLDLFTVSRLHPSFSLSS